MGEPLVWVMSLEHGEFRVECPFPLSQDDQADIADFLDVVRRQIARGAKVETQATS